MTYILGQVLIFFQEGQKSVQIDIAIWVAMIMMLSGIFCNFHSVYAQEDSKVINVEENTLITLENGGKVTAEEFLDILENYEGDIYKINDLELELISNDINKNENNISFRFAIAIPINDVMKIMAGTWYIPGIGKIVVVGGAILTQIRKNSPTS